MSLSDPSKTRRHHPKHSVSSLNSAGSPTNSLPGTRKGLSLLPGSSGTLKRAGNSNEPSSSSLAGQVKTHERSSSDLSTKVSLSKESSSVTSLPALRKAGNSSGKFDGLYFYWLELEL